jgi:predicted aconitase with swiveling domain
VIVIIRGRGISGGCGTGQALVSPAAISFLSGVNPETGTVVEKGHPLEGQSIAGRVLVFPYGKGSTVGSYVIYALSRNGKAPAAMVNEEAEPIIAVGAIIGRVPLVDRLEGGLSRLRDGDLLRVNGDMGAVEILENGEDPRRR